jgi:hypothetical protein
MCASSAPGGVGVNDVLAKIKQPGNQSLHVQTVMSALRAYHLPNEHTRPLSLPRLRESLAQGWPVIALVNYGRLPASLKADPDYNANHFVVIVGYTADGYFFVHDPLWREAEKGAYQRWSEVVLGEALAFVRDAMPMQGVVVKRPFPVEEPHMGELGLVVATALAHGTVAGYLEQLYAAMDIAPGPQAERQGHALARIAVWRAATKNL